MLGAITMEMEMKINHNGSANWMGGLKDGRGEITTESGALSGHPYGFANRFEGVRGTNPEELVGAAHAACFAMALSMMLGEAGFTAERLESRAVVTLEKQGEGFAVTASALTLEARIPGIDQATFDEVTAKAKAGCPISKLLNTAITLEATLV